MKVYNNVCELPANTSSVVAVGLFDGLHLGHHTVIERALAIAQEENLDTIVLTFDITEKSHPNAKRTDNRLLTPSLFESTLCNMGINAIVRLSFESICMLTDREFAQNILVHCLGAQAVCCGQNFRFGRGATGNVDTLCRFGDEMGFSAEILPLTYYNDSVISATRIRACIEAGDLELAANMLGRPYSIDFIANSITSAHHTSELPTIRQVFSSNYAKPPVGVYASAVYLSGVRFPAVSNIFVDNANMTICETHPKSSIATISNTHVKVELLSYLHPLCSLD